MSRASEGEPRWILGEDFPYRIKQVNKAGERIRKARTRGEQPSPGDRALLDAFRAWHYPTLRQVQDRLARVVHKKLRFDPGVVPVTARPLKTPEAIIAKLVREKTRLSTMQDIAGTRVKVPTLGLQDRLLQATLEHFKNCKPRVSKDSRENANRYGYRAVHVVVSLGGRLAEIQIRTPGQETWAQIVEKLDEGAKTDLKHGNGPAEWLEWLHDLSDSLRRADLGQSFELPPTPLDQLIDQS